MSLATEVETATEELEKAENGDQLREIISSLFSDENINLKTVLNARQVMALTTALAFAEEHDVELIKKVALYFMRLKVSEKARGRTDMRAVLESVLKSEQNKDSREYDRLINR